MKRLHSQPFSLIAVIAILFLLRVNAFAQAKIRVLVTDQSTAPIRGALVIVDSLEKGKGELSRALTDSSGRVELIASSGDYQIVAMYPLSWFKDAIKEVRVNTTDVDVRLALPAWHDQYVYDSVPCNLRVLFRKTPATDARVLVRQQRTREGQRMYVTGTDGSADIQLPSEPSVTAVFYGDGVHYFDAPKTCPKAGIVYNLE